jgi:uncharacterized protein
MNTRSQLVLALSLLATSLAACSHAPPPVVVHAERGDRTAGMTVTGTATIGVSPDCADLVLTITREAKQPGAAMASVRERQDVLIDALRQLGVADADITLSQLGVDPVYDWMNQRSALRAFEARITITATTRRFDQIGDLMEAAAAAGATSMTSRFRHTDLERLKSQVRAQAIAAAQAKATETAAALGVTLGPITIVAEANQSYLFSNTYFPPAASASGELRGDLQPLTIDVTITYDLV